MLSICVGAQKNQEANSVGSGAIIAWSSSTTYDFGNVNKGTAVTATFEFTNNGSEPLLISDAKGSCGCTSVEYSQQPIAPGAKGSVKATFNAYSIGTFNKSVTVTSNSANKREVLLVKGQVVE